MTRVQFRFTLEVIGAFTVALTGAIIAALILAVFVDLYRTSRDRRRRREHTRLVIARRRAAAAAGRAAQAQLDEEHWQAIVRTIESVDDLDRPVPFRPHVIHGIDHSPPRPAHPHIG